MERTPRNYLRLFLCMLRISAFTFGGGYVIVSLMKKQFVDRLGWMSEREMLDYTAIAQSSPGAVAVNAAILTGRGLGGVAGAAVAVLGTVLPPLVLLTAISYAYAQFIGLTAVRCALLGMQAGVAAVLCDVVLSLFTGVWRESRWIAAATALAAFVLVSFLAVNVIVVVIFCAAGGALFYGRRRERHDAA